MEIRHRNITACLALVIAVLVARLVYVAWHTECGLEAVAAQMFDAAFAWTCLTPVPVVEREPAEQARFWMAAVDEVAAGHPETAELRMGAAWMLDSPSHEFMQNHLRQSEFASALPQMGVEFDENSIAKAKAEFRRDTRFKCLELAGRATVLAPDDPRWWRMRALLLFEGDTSWSGQDFAPRSKDWLETLDACIAHDKDNALYDYLAALTLWGESASYDWPTTGNDERSILTIKDVQRFELGANRFLDAQKRKYLAIGEAGYPSIVEFLSTSGLGRQAQSDAAIGRIVTFRQSTLFLQLWRWQQARVDAASRGKDSKLAVTLHRQSLRLFDQAIIPPETSALNVLATFSALRASTFDALKNLVSGNSELMPPAEIEVVRTREKELRIESATLLAALHKLNGASQPSSKAMSFSSIAATVAIASSSALLVASVVFLVIGLLRPNKSSEVARLGVLRQVIAWLIGCGGTFIVLGMAPAELISRSIQTKAILAGIWIVALFVLAFAVWIVIALLRQRKLHFRITTLLAATTGVAVFASLWPLISAACSAVVDDPPELWLHAKGWNGINAEVLRSTMRIDVGSWLWATIQWFAFNGLYVGLSLSLTLIAVWLIWLTARRGGIGVLSFWTRDIRSRWGSLAQSLGQTSLYAAAWMFLIYLCFAPQFVRESEAKYQERMRYCRDPQAHWNQIRDAQESINSSVAEMKPILEQVDFQHGDDDVLEQDFTE